MPQMEGVTKLNMLRMVRILNRNFLVMICTLIRKHPKSL